MTACLLGVIHPAKRLGTLAVLTSWLFSSQAFSAQQSYCFSHDLPQAIAEVKEFREPMSYRINSVSGKKILLAYGTIRTGESSRLQQAFAKNPNIDEVWFDSPGGDAREGPLMGKVLRERGALTRLPKGNACVSACSYAFLGGMVRIVEPGAYYGVHMFTATRDPERMLSILDQMVKVALVRQKLIEQRKFKEEEINEFITDEVGKVLRSSEQDGAQIAAIRARYLVEMSLSLDFMYDAFNQDADGVCYLSSSGLSRYNVSNVK